MGLTDYTVSDKGYWQSGRNYERERITKLALDWISEMRGHDSDCNCRHEATVLEQFIEHDEFKGEQE
jgi:hypothetical protein